MSRREFHIGPGAASLMLVVVVLSMSVLGMLSLMNARSDGRLSARSVEVAQQTYALEAEAQRALASLDALLMQCAADAQDEAAYFAAVKEALPQNMTMEERTVRFTLSGGERALECAAELALPGEFPRCRLLEHRLTADLMLSEEWEDDGHWN